MKTCLKLTYPDSILIVFLLIVAVVWSAVIFMETDEGSIVEISDRDGIVKILPLNNDIIIPISGPLGQSIIEISSGKVFVQSSPCPNKVCVHMGAIRYAGEIIVCVPNRVIVQIKANNMEIDAITY